MANNYPVVLIHGMFGWGDGEILNDIFPYYGMITGSLEKRLRAEGIRCFAPKVGPAAGAWDRACELWAMFKGGTVDYGEAHSKKYGHERFGRTYPIPMIPDWGLKDENGDLVKVHLFGHSFGGATMREFVHLLEDGCQEEVEMSGDNVSPLFKGGKGNWVCSVTSLAAPHDGTTLVHALPGMMAALRYATFAVSNILGNTCFNKFYDLHMEQFGLTSIPGKNNRYDQLFNIKGVLHAAQSHDNLFWDLRIDGANELNKNLHPCKDIYYFSVPTLGTKDGPEGRPVPGRIMNPLLMPFANVMAKNDFSGKFDYCEIDKSWLHSDGLVPLGSSEAPQHEPHMLLKDADKNNLQKGIWHVTSPAESDHGTIVGGSLDYIGFGKHKIVDKYYMDHIKLLQTLK